MSRNIKANKNTNTFLIKRRNPNAKKLGMAGFVIFLIVVLTLFFLKEYTNVPVLLALAVLNYFKAQWSYNLVLVICYSPFIFPVFFWLAASRKQEGTLYVSGGGSITLRFERETIMILYDNIQDVRRDGREIIIDYKEKRREYLLSYSTTTTERIYFKQIQVYSSEAENIVSKALERRNREYTLSS